MCLNHMGALLRLREVEGEISAVKTHYKNIGT